MRGIAFTLSSLCVLCTLATFVRTAAAVPTTADSIEIERADDLDRPNLIAVPTDFSPDRIRSAGGDLFTLSGEIRNAGTRPSTGSIAIEVFVSKNLLREPGDPLLIQPFSVEVDLEPGESRRIEVSPSRMTHPLPPGEYFVGLAIDTTNRIPEQREVDNVGFVRFWKIQVGPPVLRAGRWSLYK